MYIASITFAPNLNLCRVLLAVVLLVYRFDANIELVDLPVEKVISVSFLLFYAVYLFCSSFSSFAFPWLSSVMLFLL